MRGKLSKLLAITLTLAMCLSMTATAFAFPGNSRGGNSGSNRPGSSQTGNSSAEESSSSSSETTLALVEDETTIDSTDATLRASTYEATTVAEDEDGNTTTETSTVKYFPVTMFNYDWDSSNSSGTYNASVAALETSGYTGIYMGNTSYSTASYNLWTGSLTNRNTTLSAVAGNQIYQGLVESTLDASGNIVFNYLDAGLFTTSAVSGKSVYTNVGLPFEYDSTTRQYSFNAKTMGAWFDGEASSDVNLVYSATPQGISNSGNEDDSPTGWFPFNDSSNTSATTESVIIGDWSAGDDISDKDEMTNATAWTITKTQNGYYFSTTSGSTGYYLTIATSNGGAATLSSTTSSRTVTINTYDDGSIDIGRSSNSNTYYLNQYGGASYNEYKSYTSAGSSDVGAKFFLYQQNEDGSWSAIDPSTLTSLSNNSSLSDIKIVSYRGQVLTATTSSTTGVSIIDTTDYTFKPVSDIDYYFGMTASIDFTMTEDGKITYTDEDGNDVTEDIVFHFSGDDDVWVFIDGTLVLDIGGIHNRIDGDIDFASGEWSIDQTYKSTDLAVDYATGTTDGSSGNLWNTSDSTGTLDTTLATFAAEETHTLTVYYMERGAGASNCEITFNLPMKDYVTVTKEADTDSEGTALTENEQEVVDNMEFTFTIYRDDDEDEEEEDNFVAYANQTYTVLNAATGNTIRTASTDANGQFTLHPGETARFTTMFEVDGESWYVVESDPGSAFDSARWSTSDSAVYNVTKTTSTKDLTSDTLTVKGSAEASSTINFVCNNILDATLANPGIVPSDDRIVIDYGLPVEIDVKSNDLYRADSYKIVAINGALTYDSDGNVTGYTDSTKNDDGSYTGTFGTITVTDAANGQLTYQLTSQLTDVEVITYIVEVSSTVVKNEATGETDTASAYAMATVYVIPATSMYYEENFVNADSKTMITYSSDWSTVGTAEKDAQEPGVVGTVGDSPYGSDVAYLADTRDSNGSSMYVSTSNSSASFSYTFTGTGTSFFARTTNNSGYMRVTIYDADNKQVRQELINTRYLSTGNEVLYNIPVFTWDAVDDGLDYGTYTVKVSLAKGNSTRGYGTDFWLDGIRVQNPMDEESENYSIAQSAYSADGEANVNIETLRDKVIDASVYDDNGDLTWGEGYAVLTDVDKNIVTASDYESIGPKEEVYLADTDYSGASNAQTISFTLEGWDMNYSLYLGLKNPTGSGATITINGHTVTVLNTADCYYSISSYLTVENTNSDGTVDVSVTITCTEGLVSVTNIKTTGTLKFAIIQDTDEDGEGGDVIVDETEVTEESEETEPVVEETELVEEPEALVEETEAVEEPETAETETTEEAEKTEVAEETQEVEETEAAEEAEETEADEVDESTETDENGQEASEETPVED